MSDFSISPRILELLISRVCHDLVSPVGAINNGVEFLSEMGADAGDDAMKLISSSVHQASTRLKNFRLCYGAAGTEKNVTFREIKEIFSALIEGGRVAFEIDAGAENATPDPARGYYKTLLNLLILAEECAHGDGKITLARKSDGEGHMITVSSSRANFKEGAEAALSGNIALDALDPRSVHPYVTMMLAKFYDITLAYNHTPKEKIVFTLSA
jgi:histidine phosphotransferase ChpT